MDSSIRLLRLKGSTPSFTNVSRKIECLTDRYDFSVFACSDLVLYNLYKVLCFSDCGFCELFRRFTHAHLAQLKFILPEAVVIEKILVLDERNSCMKPDLHVTIDPAAVESAAKGLPQSGNVSLRRMFRDRLRDFCKSHPEVVYLNSNFVLLNIRFIVKGYLLLLHFANDSVFS